MDTILRTNVMMTLLAGGVLSGALGCQVPNAFPPGERTARRTPVVATTDHQLVRNRQSAEGEQVVVRGQNTGYQIPPSYQAAAPAPGNDAFSRGPMGVSGQVTPGQLAPRVAGAAAPGIAASGNVPQPGYRTTLSDQESLPTPPPASPTPGVTTYQPPSQPQGTVPSLDLLEPSFIDPTASGNLDSIPSPMMPRTRQVPVDIYVEEARTGRFMIGGAVNSDAGVTGQIVIDERNADLTAFPRSFQELFSGRAFRGAGQTFRLEAVPGDQFQRYMLTLSDPFLFGYLPVSFTFNGFLYDRRYQDYDESRKGGAMLLGYRVTPDLSLAAGVRAQNVDFRDPRIIGIPEVDALVGDHDLFTGQIKLVHDTRDIPFAPSEGSRLEISYEQIFGSFDYPRYQVEFTEYFLLRQRPDMSGRHVLSYSVQTGFSGSDTPIFENYFAGGYTTLRGFDFRGASPKIGNFTVGGRFQFLGSLEYRFPLTADDMLQGVTFVDFGTVERDIEMNAENFRVAPGFGFRVSVPAMGPAPLAFDFAFPVAEADGDEKRVFSFFMGIGRF